jgi:hypothetical protein
MAGLSNGLLCPLRNIPLSAPRYDLIICCHDPGIAGPRPGHKTIVTGTPGFLRACRSACGHAKAIEFDVGKAASGYRAGAREALARAGDRNAGRKTRLQRSVSA